MIGLVGDFEYDDRVSESLLGMWNRRRLYARTAIERCKIGQLQALCWAGQCAGLIGAWLGPWT